MDTKTIKTIFSRAIYIMIAFVLAFSAMGNASAQAPKPRFTVYPVWNAVEAWDWPVGVLVTAVVNGKSECFAYGEPGYPEEDPLTNVWMNFPEDCDVTHDDVVTLTAKDGTLVSHTVQNLTVTKTNQEDDTIQGTAEPGAEVYVWPHATGQEQLAIAKTKGPAQGKWSVDFSETYDLAPGECGRSEIRDGSANSTAVDWCISNPRIVVSESGDWFWTTEFKPGDLDISIYDSPDEGANLLWSGQQVADEWGFALVEADIHGQDLVPGNYLVVSDGDSQKSLVLQPISVTMFDTQYEFMAGYAPAGTKVWASAGPQNWQERIMINADPVTGEWFADFAEIEFDITEDMQPWSYASIYDEDGDANEGSVPPLEFWVAAFTYDLTDGTLTDGTYPYHFEFEWSFPEPDTFSGQGGEFVISSGAPVYDGYVLLRGERELRGIKYPEELSCEEVYEINPNQPMRFLIGWLPDYGMTYPEAQTYFGNLTGRAVWGDDISAELTPYEIIPFSWDDLDSWFQYVCTFTEAPPKMDLRVNYGYDWVESFYEAGHEVVVTVTESDGETVKATATVWTEPKDFWENRTGFQTAPDDWDPGPPDLLPYDWVYAQVDNGATAQVQLGEIHGEVDNFTDSITGTIFTTWIDDPVQVECLDWGSGEEPFENKDGGFIFTDSADPYSCSWAGEWDIQPWQDIGVGYLTPEGHWVANAFRDERWMAFWTYTPDPSTGLFTEGEHSYYYQWEYTTPVSDSGISDPRTITIAGDSVPIYDGFALIGPWGWDYPGNFRPQQAWTGSSCEEVSVLNPDQPMRFVWGWVNDYSMAYEQARAHFTSLTIDVFWDGDTSGSAPLSTMSELLPFTGMDVRFEYLCAFTEHF